MSDRIELIRYFRFIEPYEKNPSNLYGITFKVGLDYDSMNIYLAYSACVGDNFDKTTGKDLAEYRYQKGIVSVFPMNPGIPVRAQIMNWIMESSDHEAKKLKRIMTSIVKRGCILAKQPMWSLR